MFFKKFNHQTWLILIVLLGFSLRLIGLNWDNGQHLQPDERFLTMVMTKIKLPTSLFQYFNTAASPLNPTNYSEYKFFVYGTFPVFLTKTIAVLTNLDSYTDIHYLGRILSAFFDCLSIIILYFLSRRLLPSFLYATTVLPVQLSHFFAVDTFLSTFLLLTFFLLTKWFKCTKTRYLFLASLTYGLAFSTKVSSVYFAPIIFIFIIVYLIKHRPLFILLIPRLLISLAIVFTTFRVFQPYAFTGIFQINPVFISNLSELNQILNTKDVFYPPEIQYLSKIPIIFPLQNIIIWGFGLPLSLVLFLYPFFNRHQKTFPVYIISLSWIFLLVIVQGSQFTNTVRYFLPIYPSLCLISSVVLTSPKFKKLKFIFIGVHRIYLMLFMGLYFRSHSRTEATDWIYQNVKSDSVILGEYWDDPLPFPSDKYPQMNFTIKMIPFYDPDNPEKWSTINALLNSADYYVLSSNRLWSSIPAVPSRYPQTTQFYQDLFDDRSQFHQIAKFVSYPGINLPFLRDCYYFGPTNYPYRVKSNQWFEIEHFCRYPGFYLRDDTAEESFTVYDHPQVIIFKNSNKK